MIALTPATHIERTVRVLGVGHIAVDLMFEVEAIPTRPIKTPAHRHRQGVGGMTANASVAAARLGAQVNFISPVGDDAYASVFERHLQSEGLDTAGLVRVPGQGSSVSAILLDAQGERLIVNCRGSALTAAPAWSEVPVLRQALQGIASYDVLLVDPRCPAWAEAALRAAREAGVPSVLDGDVAPAADLQRLVGLAQWVVFSWPGLESLMRALGRDVTMAPPQDKASEGLPLARIQDSLQTALGLGAKAAAVTLGEQGVVWRQGSAQTGRQPAFRVHPVVDTVGAGDVFHGALAVSLAGGLEIPQAMRFASAAAALKCREPGGVLGAPRRSQVEALAGSVA